MLDRLAMISFFVLCPLAFVLMVSGYVWMTKHAWRMPDRKTRLKKIFLSVGWNEYHQPPQAINLIGVGALFGFLGFLFIGLRVWTLLRR